MSRTVITMSAGRRFLRVSEDARQARPLSIMAVAESLGAPASLFSFIMECSSDVLATNSSAEQKRGMHGASAPFPNHAGDAPIYQSIKAQR